MTEGAAASASLSGRGVTVRTSRAQDWGFVLFLAVALWTLHVVWLLGDTRPPVWDMAMHQSYALNYLPGNTAAGETPYWEWSGNYPPFVHLAIACAFMLFHPGPHIAVLANIPATLLLFFGVYELGRALSGPGAGRWACILTALTPYLIWMSRETILDYWLSGWVAVSLVLLLKSRGFASRPFSLLLGLAMALGLLTKWLYGGFLAFPLLYVSIRHRVWRSAAGMTNLADTALIAGTLAGAWYLPNLAGLVRYFSENAQIGALEGEPAVFSSQSLIYYLRLLEGYQLFGLLFAVLVLSGLMTWKKQGLWDRTFWLVSIAGGWLVMTLLRTKDPRFTMPLLGPLAVVSGIWIHSWGDAWKPRAAKAALVALLCFQAYAINFGIRWLPQEVVLAKGYQGSLRWDWNLYMQHYFHILGAPSREDWKQQAILERVVDDARRRGVRPELALVPDLPRFSAANFHLFAKLGGLPVRVEHLHSADKGVRSFDGYSYVLMTEREQGMSWSTVASARLNQIIVDRHDFFRLLELYPLPNGDSARLYYLAREEKQEG